MNKKIQLLDCTLRDGCYIVNAEFGTPVIKGIMTKLDAANVDIIECGWLKDSIHKPGTAYYHQPSDVIPYLPKRRNPRTAYILMFDWDRYNLDNLPPRDGQSIDAIRIVFPHGKFHQAIPLGAIIKERGYRLLFQAANTLAYSNEDLVELAQAINVAAPESISIVDTFGAMYPEDLQRIFAVLDKHLAPDIKLGFHSHNNLQLSFAMSMEFLRLSEQSARTVIADSSLCGLGRGAGNTTTELLANYLNRKYHGAYDMNEIMDCIDMYIMNLSENYKWGYSIPHCIAGMYCTHVNNIAYLIQHHKTLSKDMRLILESLDPEKRKSYDYDYLEKAYVNYQNRAVDDSRVLVQLQEAIRAKSVLLLGPGRTQTTHQKQILEYIQKERPVVLSINSIPEHIDCDYYLFVTPSRYVYAKETMEDKLHRKPVILTSNIKRQAEDNEFIVNFSLLYKLGWQFFDNSCIMALRLMAKLQAKVAAFAGFDGFPEDDRTQQFYADKVIQPAVDLEKRRQINADVADMLRDFVLSDKSGIQLRFITPSRFQDIVENTDK